jgi:hypothetical protein
MPTGPISRCCLREDLTGCGYSPSGTVPGALMTISCPALAPYVGAMTREVYKHGYLSKWQEFGDHFEMVDVDDGHYGMLSENNIDSFAEKLRAALSRGGQALSTN